MSQQWQRINDDLETELERNKINPTPTHTLTALFQLESQSMLNQLEHYLMFQTTHAYSLD